MLPLAGACFVVGVICPRCTWLSVDIESHGLYGRPLKGFNWYNVAPVTYPAFFC